MEGEEAPSLSVLKVDLVMRKLESFLEHKDLKNMREVSRGMNALILSQTQFIAKSKIVLRKSVYKNPGFKKISFQPINVRVSVFKVKPIECLFDDKDLRNQEITDMVCKLVQDCDYLEIYDEDCWTYHYFSHLSDARSDHTYNFDEVIPPNHCPPVLEVISCVKHLKELKLVEGTELYLNKATEETATALASVQRIEFDNNCSGYCPPIFLKLRSVRWIFGHNSCGCSDESNVSKDHAQHERFKEIELNNRETLVGLDLAVHSEWFRSKFFGNAFPSLKSLTIAAGGVREENKPSAVEFLENHIDQLKKLHLKVQSSGADQVLRTFSNCKRPFKNLEVTLLPGVERSASVMDSMKYLRNIPIETFKLRTCWDHHTETDGAMTADIFSLLPVSLKSFTLNSESGIFYDHSKLKDFSHLTYLKLNNFVGSLNSTVEAVYKHLDKLEYLKIICNDDVPEVIARSEVEHSGSDTRLSTKTDTFENLKDLQFLKIFGPNLSLHIINGIKCGKLRTLIIPNVLRLAALTKILQENPCLKYIRCSNTIECRFP